MASNFSSRGQTPYQMATRAAGYDPLQGFDQPPSYVRLAQRAANPDPLADLEQDRQRSAATTDALRQQRAQWLMNWMQAQRQQAQAQPSPLEKTNSPNALAALQRPAQQPTNRLRDLLLGGVDD